MNKDTLADIVKKSLRFANSVVDSAYDFPDVRHCLEPEERFRELLDEYFTTYETNPMRGPMLKEMLGYMASRYEQENNLLKRIRGFKKEQIIYASATLACIPLTFVTPASLFGIILCPKTLIENRLRIRKLETEQGDARHSNDTAKELMETDYKLLDKALYDEWIEIKMLLDDVSEPVKEKLERIKKHK